MQLRRVLLSAIILAVGSASIAPASAFPRLIDDDIPARFLSADDAAWVHENVPLFDCPDKDFAEIYYFRWHVYRRHIRNTPDGYVITEFLPDVPWAGKDNTIACAAGHHFYEGRWIRDPQYLNDYSRFWFRKGGEPHRYSFWDADAMYNRFLVNDDKSWITNLLPELVNNYQAWESTHLDPNGLYWQSDDRDGMEYSIGGSGCRPTLNSYQFGDAIAISKIARLAGRADIAAAFGDKGARLKELVQDRLWDKDSQFFKTLPRRSVRLAAVREQIGFIPWYFNLPDPGYEAAWKQIDDPAGFAALWGITTAEQRSGQFMFKAAHDCLWNGPVWPYATTQTLVAMANLLNNYQQSIVSRADYFRLLTTYARSQHKDGHPWIAEDLDGRTGKWIVDLPRSVDYNHSAFCDLVITGLIGLRPRADDAIEINPLIPDGAWDYFALDRIPYHGHTLAIFYDKTGDHYHHGTGLHVWVDGSERGQATGLTRLIASLHRASTASHEAPQNSAGWMKYPNNPVLGGKLGTCFDVCVLKDRNAFRQYFSWRPKKSVALVESADGIHWSDPQIVLSPNSKTDWESDINRPVVLRQADGYHMWYTGQSRGRSAIGYATSADGRTWTRQSDKPVLLPDQPWEKVAVMCPHVIWDDGSRQFRMWYSGGEQYEPDAIGYATSRGGVRWTKHDANPIFRADPAQPWEQFKVTACQVVPHGEWYYMFYIGFRDVNHAQIGLARSRDGITGWQRLAANPIIGPTPGTWDSDACYKPFAIYQPAEQRWMLWYNGRHGSAEQIGLATHFGENLWSAR